jgi:simple sugar transport system permease protein
MIFIVDGVITRIGRNTFTVLALIIPVIAGLGLNFGMVIGAVAAQIAFFGWYIGALGGSEGILLCVHRNPNCDFFGYLVGKLFNQMKGTEMIAGLILGYFADGLYQLLFLVIIGGVIPVDNPTLIISHGVGVKNTIDLTGESKVFH